MLLTRKREGTAQNALSANAKRGLVPLVGGQPECGIGFQKTLRGQLANIEAKQRAAILLDPGAIQVACGVLGLDFYRLTRVLGNRIDRFWEYADAACLEKRNAPVAQRADGFFEFFFAETGRKICIDSPRIRTLSEVFFIQNYAALEPAGERVLDLGANVGDTAIYFMCKGAKYVYALEPYPKNCRRALQNIQRNGMGEQIKVINAGISRVEGEVLLDPEFHSDPRNDLKKFDKGVTVKLQTIGRLVDEYGLKNAVLKLDCEGAEVGAILESGRETLRAFKRIIMEYHHGYMDLKDKLESAGFYVKLLGNARIGYNQFLEAPVHIYGMLCAWRK